jgi:hypothetical protein
VGQATAKALFRLVSDTGGRFGNPPTNRRPICFSPKRAAGVAATDDRPGREGVWGEPCPAGVLGLK